MEAVVTITETGCRRVEPCGCEVEGVSGITGELYWVPIAACPDHCECLGCLTMRYLVEQYPLTRRRLLGA